MISVVQYMSHKKDARLIWVKIFVLSIFEWPFYVGFTVKINTIFERKIVNIFLSISMSTHNMFWLRNRKNNYFFLCELN